jgi:hypothetical protein
MISLNDILKGHGFSSAFGDATAAQILNGKKATTSSGLVTGTMPNRPMALNTANSAVINAATNKISLYVPVGYYPDGAEVYAIDSDLIAANILQGKDIFGLVGSLVQGKKFASGTIPIFSSGSDIKIITGLGFTPKVVELFFSYTSQGTLWRNNATIWDTNQAAYIVVASQGLEAFNIVNGGFSVQCQGSYNTGVYYSYFTQITYEARE